MNFREARALYDALPSRDRVGRALARLGPCPVVVASGSFGRVEVTARALDALDLDNLFSARWRGETVEGVVLAALAGAAEGAQHGDGALVVVCRFPGLGAVTLRAEETPDGVRIDA